MVARLVRDEKVAGSNPVSPTNPLFQHISTCLGTPENPASAPGFLFLAVSPYPRSSLPNWHADWHAGQNTYNPAYQTAMKRADIKRRPMADTTLSSLEPEEKRRRFAGFYCLHERLAGGVRVVDFRSALYRPWFRAADAAQRSPADRHAKPGSCGTWPTLPQPAPPPAR